MKCLFCKNEGTRVIDKRESTDNSFRRRRECKKCKKRFTTYERPEIGITVVKKDGTRENYDREKLKKGVMKSCEKRDVPVEKIEEIISKIEEKLREKGPEVKTSKIGREVMKKLKRVDKIAYIRFASVYREFKDIEDFETELKKFN